MVHWLMVDDSGGHEAIQGEVFEHDVGDATKNDVVRVLNSSIKHVNDVTDRKRQDQAHVPST